MHRLIAVFAVLFAALSLRADGLTVVKAGPVGEVASLAEANEIRVVFSEPMVALGKTPKKVDVPWMHIEPAIAGSFRWSGTTTLIFTPGSRTPLPYATRYDVTIDGTAKSVAGHTLEKEVRFSFITPTIQLLNVNWYRKDGFSGPVIVALRFNQPVEPQAITQHLQLKTAPHDPPVAEAPSPDAASASAQQAFTAKKASADAAAASSGATVLAFVTDDWDRKRFPPSPDLVVLETKPGIAPGTDLHLFLDSELARSPANVRTGRAQEFTVKLAPPLFVKKINCTSACDPDAARTIEFTKDVAAAALQKAISVGDVTTGREVPVEAKAPSDSFTVDASEHSLDEFGYSLLPAHKYVVRIAPTLVAKDGETLGYEWVGEVDDWHRTAFTSFGDGNGVWESSGGPILPFYARNFRNVKQWMQALTVDDLVPTLIRLEKNGYKEVPPRDPQLRALTVHPDDIQSFGVDTTAALGTAGHGLLWVAVQNGETIEHSRVAGEETAHATIVQVTNLGISVKDSPLNTLVLVTRLTDGSVVQAANVSIRTLDNHVFWSGRTDEHGVAMAPKTDLRRSHEPAKPSSGDGEGEEDWENSWKALDELHFVVIAEKDSDVAYTASNWHEGVSPYDFGVNFDLSEAEPQSRGTIFTDRGVYKPGEEVHAKLIARKDTPDGGMQLYGAGTRCSVTLTDSHDKEVEHRDLTFNDWSSAEFTITVPADGPLGNYELRAKIEGRRTPIEGSFLTAAYRRPEFRVDATLGSAPVVAGEELAGSINGRYLFGAPMSRRPVRWTYARQPLFEVPAAIADRFSQGFTFLGYDERIERQGTTTISSKEVKLDPSGLLSLKLPTVRDAGWPYQYTIEGEVTDVSRQKIAGRASQRVDPAPWYIGVKTPPFFADAEKGLDTEIVAASLNGTPTAGVNVDVDLVHIQWNSVRRAEGNGFYTWDTERKELKAGHWSVTTQTQPVSLHVPIEGGGEFELIATAKDAEGHTTKTRVPFYAFGGGYTAWERYDHNRIDLVPEKATLEPGQSARVMIKSPWEHATALVTTEREGVRTWREMQLDSTQQTVTIPVTEADIPNVFVSVLLVKGRSSEATTADTTDPGKPSFRLGYCELKVVDVSKRLQVTVKANREEYRPANKAAIDVEVHDARKAAARSEVTLWAVDYGVLSLTDYRTPDILQSIYREKALQVVNDDSREKIIGRRVITPKGGGEGGGGGRDAGPGMLRKDFRVLAFWVGSIVTDRHGRAHTTVTLPESLTTYRIMAVASDQLSRFGSGQAEIRINKPLLLTPTFPRFLSIGDKAFFGAVVHSQLAKAGTASVTITSTDPSILEITDAAASTTAIDAKGSAEVRFHATAKRVGTAHVRVAVSMNGESDAFEDTIPIRFTASEETVAAYGAVGAGDGQAAPSASAEETLEIPAGVVPDLGGLHIDLASTELAGLGEGARYLVDYPYGCAEQRSSGALAVMLAGELGGTFALPGIDARDLKTRGQTAVTELKNFQCGDGGFAFWAGSCESESPYLTSWVVHVLQRARKLGYTVDPKELDAAYAYLEKELATKRPDNEAWWPAYTAWQAFTVSALADGGRNEDSHINRLLTYADRMPLFGIAHLANALIAKGEQTPRLEELRRRLLNAVLPEGGTAHVEELTDPYLLWFWNSNIRSTAIVLETLVRGGSDPEIARRMVHWLMNARVKGRWGTTQENAWAMEALIDYVQRYESATPDFSAHVTAGPAALVEQTFKGRSTEVKSRDVSMPEVLRLAPAESRVPLRFSRDGAGTLVYAIRLRYAQNVLQHDALDRGIEIERHYAVQGARTPAHDPISFHAGDLIQVTLRIRNTKERRFVAVTDPIPAGTEPVESWFATTATDLAEAQEKAERGGDDWMAWWRYGGFDHVERHDERVDLFATRLSEGAHEFKYMLRATTAGSFLTSPAHAEEMYEPEVFGRTASDVVEITP